MSKDKNMTMDTYISNGKVRLRDFNKEKKSPKKKIMIMGIGIFCVGILFILFSILMIISTYTKKSDYESIKGYVIEVENHRIIRNFYKGVIEYEVGGQIYKIKRFGLKLNPETINEKFEVLYMNDNPDDAYLVANEVDKTIYLAVFGVIVFISGILVFIKGNKMPIPIVFDASLEIPNPNDIYLRQVAEEKARLAAEQAAYEAEQARLAAEAEQKRLEAEAKGGPMEVQVDENGAVIVDPSSITFNVKKNN